MTISRHLTSRTSRTSGNARYIAGAAQRSWAPIARFAALLALAPQCCCRCCSPGRPNTPAERPQQRPFHDGPPTPTTIMPRPPATLPTSARAISGGSTTAGRIRDCIPRRTRARSITSSTLDRPRPHERPGTHQTTVHPRRRPQVEVLSALELAAVPEPQRVADHGTDPQRQEQNHGRRSLKRYLIREPSRAQHFPHTSAGGFDMSEGIAVSAGHFQAPHSVRPCRQR